MMKDVGEKQLGEIASFLKGKGIILLLSLIVTIHASEMERFVLDMAQVKIYGLKENLARNKAALSEIIHASLVKVLGLPADKKFQRFLPMDPGDFLFPPDRTPAYTIVEISMFEGRSEETLKSLIHEIMKESQTRLELHPNDLEITVFQSPKYCWGIRGKTGDDLALGYKVDV